MSSRGLVWVAVAASLTGTAAVLVATIHGPGLTTDSTYYLSAGVGLADGRGLTTFDGAPLVVFAPALSAVVAFGQLLGLDAQTTVRGFNAVMAGLTVWLGFVLLRRHVRSPVLAVGATVLLGVSVPLLHAASWAMTEPAFVVTGLVLILALERAHDGLSPPLGALAVVVVTVWVAFLFRYAGLVYIAIVGFTLLFGPPALAWRRRVARAVGVAVAASVVPVAWMIRNRAVDGSLLAERSSSPYGLIETLDHVVSTLGYWLVPGRSLGGEGRLFLGLLALALGTVVGLVVVRRSAPNATARNDLGPLAIFVAAYLAYMIVAQLSTAIAPLDSRLLIPIYVPLVVLAAVFVERASQTVHGQAAWAVPAALALGVLFLVGQGVLLVRDVRLSARMGDGYNSEFWRQSEAARVVDGLPPEADIVSNNAHAIWAATGRINLSFAPAIGEVQDEVDAMSAERYLEVACGDAYLVWFDSPSLPMYGFTADRLPPTVLRSEVQRLDDGVVYRLSPMDPASCPR